MNTDEFLCNQPLTRRHVLKMSALGAISLLATSPAKAQAASALPIKRGGALVHADVFNFPSMDPMTGAMSANHLSYTGMFDSLVRLELADPKTGEQKVVPELAESWEFTNPTTLVFKLRKGVTFHDGSPFNAATAAWNFIRMRDHKLARKTVYFVDMEAAEAVDTSTLRIKLKTPNAGFVRNLAYVAGARVPFLSKAAFDKNGDQWLQRNAVGTGPFRFKQWIADDRVLLERFADYWDTGADGKQLPYLDSVTCRYIPDPSVSMLDLRAGTVHLLESVAAKDAATVKADPNLFLMEQPWAGQGYYCGSFNTEAKPFEDVRVRQAANYAIDRAGMAKTLGHGMATPFAYPFWREGALGFDPSVERYDYNPDKAKQLLRDAGYPNGLDVTLLVIKREPEETIAQFMQQSWATAGIRTKLDIQERLTTLDMVAKKNFQAYFWRGSYWTMVDPDVVKMFIMCGSQNNYGQWCDRDIDKAMNDGAAEQDPKKRDAIYRRAFKTLMDKAYMAHGILLPMMTAYRKELKGLAFNYHMPNLRAAWLDK